MFHICSLLRHLKKIKILEKSSVYLNFKISAFDGTPCTSFLCSPFIDFTVKVKVEFHEILPVSNDLKNSFLKCKYIKQFYINLKNEKYDLLAMQTNIKIGLKLNS